MKKILSLILSILIIGSCCTIAIAEETEKADLSFALASDTHVCPPVEELEKTNNDPIFWYANRRAAMENESTFIFDSFLKQCENDDSVEFVLISGDLTDGGKFRPEEHDIVTEKLRDFEKRSGKEVYVIAGNHDLSIDGFGTDDFKREYAEFGYDHALTISDSDCSYTANLGEKYRLIAFDSCDPSRSTGDGVTTERLAWVKKQTDSAKADGRYPILMMHHNLLDHMPMQTIFSKDFIIGNHLAVAEMFADWGIKLVFTGHEHCSDVTSYTSALGNVITDFATTALSMYPIEYRVFSLTDSKITYEAKEVESIDTAAVANASVGYTPEMLAAMDANLNEFSKGFLKAGVQYRLARGMEPDKLGIAEDAIYHDIVMNIVGKFTGLLKMPLYGEESVQSIAKKYSIDIPDSKYKNGWDLATELVAAHYAGSESFGLNSTEVTILLRTVALILREESSLIGEELYWNAASDILEYFSLAGAANSLRDLLKSVFGRVTAGEYLLVSIVSPLLYEFAYDSDGINDNNGTIAGYGTVTVEGNITNINNNLYGIIDTIMTYINLMLQCINNFISSLMR